MSGCSALMMLKCCSRILYRKIGWCILFWGFNSSGFAATEVPAEQLVQELGCSSCHTGLASSALIERRAPDLGYAGLRYEPAYLFDYLQHPTPVRRHIGRSRMPDFQLSQVESLALTLFLQQEVAEPKTRSSYPDALEKAVSVENRGRRIVEENRCLECHSLQGVGGSLGVDLETINFRLNKQWVKKFLANPELFQPGTIMPNLFFHTDSGEQLHEVVPDAVDKINGIVEYLYSLDREQASQLQRTYEKALSEYPEANAELGRKIFVSQNCIACHLHPTISATKNAPDLSIEGLRVNQAWLTQFLKKPKPIRPFGYYPGSGSRMPDFGLTDAEVGIIGDYLMQQISSSVASKFKMKTLSRFSQNKAYRLIKEKLSCLGCHRLGTDGGKIGPDLSNLKNRLQASYVYQFIKQPQSLDADTMMPEIRLPDTILELVVNFLMQQEIDSEATSYLSLISNPPQFNRAGKTGRLLYEQYCAQCHGSSGEGNGFNARYLGVTPTRFADAAYMAERPDDTLFDGVYVGGYVLNKSHFMPPWGETLSDEDIRSLVAYVRELCQCSGPSWSLDN